MSGHKMATVTISQEEYRKLYEAEHRLRYSIQDLTVKGQTQAVDGRMSIFDQLVAYNNQQSSILSNHSARQNAVVDREMEDMRRLYETQLSNVKKIIDSQNKQLNGDRQQNNEKMVNLSAQVDELIDRLDAMIVSQNQEKKESQIRYATINEDVDQLLIDFGNDLDTLSHFQDHKIFPYEKFERLVNQMDLVQQNIDNEYYESAIGILQNSHLDACELLKKTAMERSMLFLLETQLSERFENLRNFVASNEHIEAVTRDGSNTGVFLNLQEWSDGRFQALSVDLDNLHIWFEQNRQHVDFEDLRQFETAISAAEDHFHDAIITAHTNAINSQLKYEVANQILLALVSQGYIPNTGHYVNNNGNERYYARASNADGCEITIHVDDAGKNEIGNKVSILSSDYLTRTQHELKHRAQEIKEAVSRYGLDISDMVEAPLSGAPKADHINYTKESHNVSMRGQR